jgi:NADH:quinone reductase (non-electrogenic)
MGEQKTVKLDIAVVGGGFAGVYCARRLGRTLGQELQIGLISDQNYMVFQPMLPEVAGSSVSPRHVVNPLRLLCKHTTILRGLVESIDWPNRSLVLDAGPFTGNLRITYSELVIALGAVVNLSRIPGMPEHAFLMQNVGDAMYLRSTILGRLEEANLEPRPDIKRRLTSFVVVGGGFSGVETAGHILDLFMAIRPYYPNLSSEDLSVHLIHGGDHLLPTLSRKLGGYSARKLEHLGLRIIFNQRVKSMTASRVYLENGKTIETNTVICTVGNAPHPLVLKLGQDCGLEMVKGRLLTEATGQVKGQTHLWAVGDCAAFPLVTGGLCPQTAQFAYRQGLLVGRNIKRRRTGQGLRAFSFKGLGELASIGHRHAVADICGFHFSGFIAWWLWRTIYLLKLPRLDRKLRVMLDWTLDLFFPRDLNHLSPRFTKPVKEVHLEGGDILFQQGDPAFSFYIVKSGAVELRDGDETLQHIAAGGYFGEQALLGDGTWHYDAQATEPTSLVSIPASIFRELVSGIGSLGTFFQKSATKYQSREIVEAIGRKVAPALSAQPVSRLMERKLYTLKPHMTLQEALQITRDHPRSSYPVVDEGNRLLGMVTREDFYEFLKREQTRPTTPISQIHFAQVPTVADDTPVVEVMKCFMRTGSNKVLVLDRNNRVEGIATVMDLMAATGDGKRTEPEAASELKQAHG